MKRWFVSIVVVLATMITVLGCSGGSQNPTTPGNFTEAQNLKASNSAQTQLWGYYDVYVDTSNQTATAILNRNAMFAANVTTILNNKPATMGFKIHGIVTAQDNSYLDIDVDVSLTHPFPGLTQYNGYDVRGIFMGNGSATMAYNPALIYAENNGYDQVMYDFDADLTPEDPYAGITGSPDGYTRWFNASEFSNPGLFGYTQGVFATKNYTKSATLSPYKYFADGLSPEEDLWEFLTNTSNNGVFSAGSTNTRNYYIRFPMPNPNVKFGYAVMANWKGDQPQDHPANASEAVAIDLEVLPGIYFANSNDKGGTLRLDVSVFDWDSVLSAGVMEDYKIIVESPILSAPYIADASDMTPINGGENFSTYHIEIPADNITSNDDQDLFIIVEDQLNDYKNEYSVTNLCGDDKLAAIFRYTIPVPDAIPNSKPVVTNGVTGPQNPYLGSTSDYSVTAFDVDNDSLTYEWKVTDKATGIVDPSYNGVPGDSAGNLTVDWSVVSGIANGKKYDISCTVTDSKSAPVPANTLTATMTAINYPPIVESGVDGFNRPEFNSSETYTVTASDQNGDILSYNWTVKDKLTNLPVAAYNGVPGTAPGALTILFSGANGFVAGKEYDIYCTVTDGNSAPVSATPLTVKVNNKPVAQFSVLTPMPYVAYETAPVTFQSFSYDLDPGESATLTYEWDFDGDLNFNEPADDSIDSGTAINPTHVYLSNFVGTVYLRVKDVHGSMSTLASNPVNITVDSCDYSFPTTHSWNTSQSVSNGSFTADHIAPMVTRAASTMRIIYPYGADRFGACNAGGSGGYSFVANSSANSGGTIYRAVITSTDRIIYTDGGTNNMLYYCDWNGTTFGTMHNAWPSGSGVAIPNYNPGNIAPASRPWRMTITEDDRPIIVIPYVVSGNTILVMYVWNGSSWGSPISLPSAIQNAIGGNWTNYSRLQDMDYDPTTGFVLFVTSYNYFEGVFAVNTSGTLKWSETNIWTPAANTSKLGIEVPKFDSECRIVIFMGDDSMHSTPGFSRCNPLGGVVKDTWLSTGAGSNDIDNGYYMCLVPPNGTVTTWRLWGGSGYSSDDRHFIYRDMPSIF